MKALAAVALVGCSYHPGSFAYPLVGPFPGNRLTLDCVDLAVALAATQTVDGTQPVIAYNFGNRCSHRVMLDLATVRVVGRDEAGREVELHAFDPRGEIQPLPIDALVAGSEQLEYPAAAPIVSMCADVGGVAGSTPRQERWVCMGRPR